VSHRKKRLELVLRAISLRLGLPFWMERESLPSLLERLSRGPLEPAPLDLVEEALSRADVLAQHAPFVPSTCLYRSLARYALLCRSGFSAAFVMGIEKKTRDQGDLKGHAWVEIDGTPLGEEIDAGLVVTYRYPGSGS